MDPALLEQVLLCVAVGLSKCFPELDVLLCEHLARVKRVGHILLLKFDF